MAHTFVVGNFIECKEYYALTTKGGGTIESDGGCRTVERVEKEHDKNRLTIVGGIAAEESEFPHMASTPLKNNVKVKNHTCSSDNPRRIILYRTAYVHRPSGDALQPYIQQVV